MGRVNTYHLAAMTALIGPLLAEFPSRNEEAISKFRSKDGEHYILSHVDQAH